MAGEVITVAEMFALVRGDISATRTDLGAQISRMVSNDLFLAEQNRVDGRFREMSSDIVEANATIARLTAALEVERDERKKAEIAAAQTALEQQRAIEEQRGKNRWTLLGWVSSPVIGGIIAYVVAGGLAVPR